MPKYYNTVTGKIVEYPADAAAVFPALKPVPSERKTDEKPEADSVKVAPVNKTTKSDKNDGDTNAK